MGINTNDLALIVLDSYKDRGVEVDSFLKSFYGSEKSFIIPISNPRFSNGESKVVLKESVRNKDVYIIADVGNYSLTYNMYGNTNYMSPDEHFQDIIRTVSAISGRAKRITVIMPLMYQSRQHRRTARESLDCAMAIRYLESIGVKTIITFDIHDPEVQNAMPYGGFESAFPLYPILKMFITNEHKHIKRNNLIVISPDPGAMERSRRYAGILGLDIGMFYKRRDFTKLVNGQHPILEHQYIGPDVKGKDLLIVDDMLASGESVIDVARDLKSKGARDVFIVTTFAFFTEGIEKFDKLHKEGIIKAIYSTNGSYLNPKLKECSWFNEVPLTKFISKIIRALNNEESIGGIIQSREKMDVLLQLIEEVK